MRESSLMLEGRVVVRLVDHSGRTLRRIQTTNAIVDVGRALVGQLLVGAEAGTPVTHLAVGSDGTEPTAADTGLVAEINTIDRGPIESTALDEESTIGMRITAQVSSSAEAQISEAGLFTAADHGAGVMYNRVVFPSPLPIGPSLDLIFEWDITF